MAPVWCPRIRPDAQLNGKQEADQANLRCPRNGKQASPRD
jgi:hypothetical protein